MTFGSNGKLNMKTFYSHLDESPGKGGTAWLFREYYGLQQVTKPEDADVIIWNGGEDIGTSIYGEQPVNRGIPYQRSARDRQEIMMFDKFKNDKTKLLLGICRGAQLLNVLNGGTLWQDVNGHHSSHDMLDLRTGEVINVTSTHHQQFRPDLEFGQIIGIASRSTAKSAQDGLKHMTTTQDLAKAEDVEIVWYPVSRSLCIQGHPEYVPGSRFADYTLELLNTFFPKQQAAA